MTTKQICNKYGVEVLEDSWCFDTTKTDYRGIQPITDSLDICTIIKIPTPIRVFSDIKTIASEAFKNLPDETKDKINHASIRLIGCDTMEIHMGDEIFLDIFLGTFIPTKNN